MSSGASLAPSQGWAQAGESAKLPSRWSAFTGAFPPPESRVAAQTINPVSSLMPGADRQPSQLGNLAGFVFVHSPVGNHLLLLPKLFSANHMPIVNPPSTFGAITHRQGNHKF